MPEEVFETQQPQPEASRPLDETKPTNWPKIILFAILGIALPAGAVYAGYWYGTENAKLKSQISKPQLKTQIPVTPTPEPISSVEDETKDWEMYRNETYGYSISYPSSLEIFADVDERLELTNFDASEAAHGVFVPKGGFYVVIDVQSPEEAIKDFAEGSPYEAKGYEEVNVAGKPASKITMTVEVGPNTFLRTTVVYIPTDNYTYVSRFNFYEEDVWEFASLVDQILSTFKFLD